MADSQEILLVERGARWARLVINRPGQSNAADFALWERIGDAVEELGADPDLSALIVTGAGSKAFMAGADLTEFPGVLASSEGIDRYLGAVSRALDSVERVGLPVIAEINGAAMGGGLELAIACDYRIAVPTARMGIPSADLGIGIALEDVERIAGLVGTARAREILLFARVYSAEEGLAAGLINEIAPPERLRERSEELAAALDRKAAPSLRSAKAALRALVHPAEEGVHAAALQAIRDAWRSDVLAARVRSFVERRRT